MCGAASAGACWALLWIRVCAGFDQRIERTKGMVIDATGDNVVSRLLAAAGKILRQPHAQALAAQPSFGQN